MARHVHLNKRDARYANIGGAVRPVDYRGGSDNLSAVRFQCGDAFTRRAAGCDDIFDYEDTLAGLDRKSTPQRHFAILPLGPDKSLAGGRGRGITDDQTADRGRGDGVKVRLGP